VRGNEPDDSELYEELERRALLGLPEEDADEPVDVVGALRADDGGPAPSAADLTLDGYIRVHHRVPAFEGIDGQPYTVDVDVEETGDAARRFLAFLVFIRWAATGAGIMDHVESADLAWGATADEARRGVLELSLYEVKAELDAAIVRKQRELEGTGGS
jgi:hypothetical protein